MSLRTGGHLTQVDHVRAGDKFRVIGLKDGKTVFNEVVEPGRVQEAEARAWQKVRGKHRPLGRGK